MSKTQERRDAVALFDRLSRELNEITDLVALFDFLWRVREEALLMGFYLDAFRARCERTLKALRAQRNDERWPIEHGLYGVAA